MNSSRNSFEMMCLSRFIILQSVVTRYLFVQKVVNCCRHLEIPKYVKGVAKANEQQQEIFSVRKGDIFFTRTSESIEEIGMAAVCKHTIKDAVFSGFLIRCRPRMPLINEDYMKYYLQIPAVRNHFSSMMNIVIRASLGGVSRVLCKSIQ